MTATADEAIRQILDKQETLMNCSLGIILCLSILIGIFAAKAFNFWKW